MTKPTKPMTEPIGTPITTEETAANPAAPLIEVKDLVKEFTLRRPVLRAAGNGHETACTVHNEQ
jgi:hypothetical protein